MGTRKLAVVGSMLAGLAAVGGTAAVVASQPPPTHEVQLVQPASVLSPKQFAPTATASPTAVPMTKAPAPVQSTQARVVVSLKPKVVVVPKVVADPVPSPSGTYQDGTPVKKNASGDVIPLPAPPPRGQDITCQQQIDGHGVLIPLPAHCS